MLTRRQMIALAGIAGRIRADSSSHSAELWNYFERELTAADDRRRRRLAEIRTANELAALQEHARRTVALGVGEFPKRTPLEPHQVGEIVRADYVIEKLIFQSRPGYYVTANLYRPKSTSARRPGVVQTCGHYLEGKAAPDYARACAGLAKKGFIALIFDPMGQGERIMFRDHAGKPRYKGATGEHVVAGRPTLLLGRTLANYRIWDIMRALDYLESRLDVDASRLGLFGHSGGGMLTLLTAPLEPRVRAAMSCCAVTTFYHKTQALLMADPEQIVPDVYAQGVDHPELIAAVAPRAFLIGAVLRDFVPLDGTRRTFEEVKPLFALAGVPGNIAKVESDNEHKLDRNLREGCYGWMMKHLMGESGDTREPEIEVETEDALRCTPTGCVMDLDDARSVFDLNREEGRRLAAERAGRKAVPCAEIQELLGLGALAMAEGSEERFVSEPGIHIAATLWPARNRRDGLLILAAEQGRNSPDARKLAGELTAAGFPVLGVDLRGWGETTPNPPGKKARFSWDEFLAWRSFEMGRPLVGMRAFDLVAVARRMASTYTKVYVIGIDAGGLVALHAAALDRSIAGVAMWRTLNSYQDVTQHSDSAEPVSSFIPGVLRNYDLPEIVRSLAPRPVVAVDPRDAQRNPIVPASAQPARDLLKGLEIA